MISSHFNVTRCHAEAGNETGNWKLLSSSAAIFQGLLFFHTRSVLGQWHRGKPSGGETLPYSLSQAGFSEVQP